MPSSTAMSSVGTSILYSYCLYFCICVYLCLRIKGRWCRAASHCAAPWWHQRSQSGPVCPAFPIQIHYIPLSNTNTIDTTQTSRWRGFNNVFPNVQQVWIVCFWWLMLEYIWYVMKEGVRLYLVFDSIFCLQFIVQLLVCGVFVFVWTVCYMYNLEISKMLQR